MSDAVVIILAALSFVVAGLTFAMSLIVFWFVTSRATKPAVACSAWVNQEELTLTIELSNTGGGATVSDVQIVRRTTWPGDTKFEGENDWILGEPLKNITAVDGNNRLEPVGSRDSLAVFMPLLMRQYINSNCLVIRSVSLRNPIHLRGGEPARSLLHIKVGTSGAGPADVSQAILKLDRMLRPFQALSLQAHVKAQSSWVAWAHHHKPLQRLPFA